MEEIILANMRDIRELSNCFIMCNESCSDELSMEELRNCIKCMGLTLDNDELYSVIRIQEESPPFDRESVKTILIQYQQFVKNGPSDDSRLNSVIQYAELIGNKENVVEVKNKHGTRKVLWKEFLIHSFVVHQDLDLFKVITEAEELSNRVMIAFERKQERFKKEFQNSVFIDSVKEIVNKKSVTET